ncbi:MAG: sigma-70 family RNA polymerase sigma factor [Eggerthellaceae bacterium]|nr:sigma-70 family RNA polymerase sigma factor [Eggerthellaceae bacterium]
MVYGYIRARMGSDAEAEDIVAEAYLKAARAFDRFDPSRAQFVTWVTTIAKNCMASYYRKNRTTFDLDDVPESVVAIEGEQGNVDDALLVRQLLTCLDEEERELIALKYRDGLRNVDIAQELNMNASTVSTKLAHALTKMRTMLKKGA